MVVKASLFGIVEHRSRSPLMADKQSPCSLSASGDEDDVDHMRSARLLLETETLIFAPLQCDLHLHFLRVNSNIPTPTTL
jgi:hypothetical protein